MNKLKDTDLREALRRKEKQQAPFQLPPDFCKNVMQEVRKEEPPKALPKYRFKRGYVAAALAMAASLLLLFSLAQKKEAELASSSKEIAQHEIALEKRSVGQSGFSSRERISSEIYSSSDEELAPKVCRTRQLAAKSLENTELGLSDKMEEPKELEQNQASSEVMVETRVLTHNPASATETDKAAVLSSEILPPVDEPKAIYASKEADENYQDPAKMDELILNLAEKLQLQPVELENDKKDSLLVSTVYLFPDKKEIDLMGRLMQGALWYSDDIPGYFLNFSHRQFFFQIKDTHTNQNYMWVAERNGRNILIYSAHAPQGCTITSVSYRKYREKWAHLNVQQF